MKNIGEIMISGKSYYRWKYLNNYIFMLIVKLLLQIVGWIIFLALWYAVIAIIVEIVKKIIEMFRGKSSGCDCGTRWFEDYMHRNS